MTLQILYTFYSSKIRKRLEIFLNIRKILQEYSDKEYWKCVQFTLN